MACSQIVTDWFLSNLYDDGDQWTLHSDTSLDDCGLALGFLQNISTRVDKMWYAATMCGFVEALAKFILLSRERTQFSCLSLWPVFGHLPTDSFQTWYELILGSCQLYSWIPVWLTLTFTQGCRVMGNLECMQSFSGMPIFRYFLFFPLFLAWSVLCFLLFRLSLSELSVSFCVHFLWDGTHT